jgi:hypothetical protein
LEFLDEDITARSASARPALTSLLTSGRAARAHSADVTADITAPWRHSTVKTGASKILARPTPFIFHCHARAARRNVTTRSPHTPELEFLDEELILHLGVVFNMIFFIL